MTWLQNRLKNVNIHTSVDFLHYNEKSLYLSVEVPDLLPAAEKINTLALFRINYPLSFNLVAKFHYSPNPDAEGKR